MKINKGIASGALVMIIFLGIAFTLIYMEKHPDFSFGKKVEENNLPSKTSKNLTLQKFIFIQDYKVEQPIYNDGDFPSGTKTTLFKKGDIVDGWYSLNGCQGVGCTPTKIVLTVVSGQNWPVETAILIPYKNQ